MNSISAAGAGMGLMLGQANTDAMNRVARPGRGRPGGEDRPASGRQRQHRRHPAVHS